MPVYPGALGISPLTPTIRRDPQNWSNPVDFFTRRVEDNGQVQRRSARISCETTLADLTVTGPEISPVTEQDALEQIFEMEKRVVLGLFDAMGITLTAAERERVLERRTEFMREPSMCNDDDTDHIAPRSCFPRPKAAIFVAPVRGRKPEPMTVHGAFVTLPKEALISA